MRVSLAHHGIYEHLRRLAGYRTSRRDEMRDAMLMIGQKWVAYVQDVYRRGGTTPDRTAVRTGRLRASYGYDVRPGYLAIGIRSASAALKYAGVHEGIAPGGEERDVTVIRPVRAQSLTIPLRAAKTDAGVTRRPPRAYRQTFVRDDIIYQRRGRDIVPLFRLVDSVTVPARPALRRIRDRVVSDVVAAVRRVYGRI